MFYGNRESYLVMRNSMLKLDDPEKYKKMTILERLTMNEKEFALIDFLSTYNKASCDDTYFDFKYTHKLGSILSDREQDTYTIELKIKYHRNAVVTKTFIFDNDLKIKVRDELSEEIVNEISSVNEKIELQIMYNLFKDLYDYAKDAYKVATTGVFLEVNRYTRSQ